MMEWPSLILLCHILAFNSKSTNFQFKESANIKEYFSPILQRNNLTSTRENVCFWILKIVSFILVRLIVVKNGDMDFSSPKMEINFKEIGLKICKMDKVNSKYCIQREPTKEPGETENLKEKDKPPTKMEHNTMDISIKGKNMVWES